MMYDQTIKDTFLFKVDEVIESMNHAIDSSHEFLYQVYHIDDEEYVNTFVTYEHNEAMKHHKQTIEKKYSTSLLCNGKSIREYGKRDRYQETTKRAREDYTKMYQSLHRYKLNKTAIIDIWNRNYKHYDQQWLLSVKREDFIDAAINVFKIGIVQNAMKLYDKFIRLIKYEEDIKDTEWKIDGDVKESADIMFLWIRKNIDHDYKQQMVKDKQQVVSLDHIHFLYVVSVILDALKLQFDKVEMKQILLCLHRVGMNGLIFSKIDANVFTGSVIIYSHSFKKVEIESLTQLVNCIKKLYEKIKEFDLESVTPSSICNISLSMVSFRGHGGEELEQKDNTVRSKNAMNELDTFQQWMITFESQYNRSTPFHLTMFKPLINKYEDDANAITNMKYDNYGTDLTDKMHDDVLKSFIAWSITLKCGNLRCEEKLKLNCYCDTNTFQMYTYRIIMGIIALKANNNYSLLNQLQNTETSVSELCDTFCEILPKTLKEHNYFKSYKSFILDWINFEFYNFKCVYCHHINKTIMIDRVYQYSKTMHSCRVCNKKQISRIRNNEPQFDMMEAIKTKNSVIDEEPYEYTEFNLHSLSDYLIACDVDPVDMKRFDSFVKKEAYDSDSVLHDIQDESKTNSNIYNEICASSKSPKCYYLMKKYLNYDRYSIFREGVLIRYLVLRPKYFSFLKEICLNDIHPLLGTNWESRILSDVLKQYHKQSVRSTISDIRFGIEKGEPIGIHHLIAIFLFTDDRFARYRRDFGRSYWLWDKNIHCNNFYWMGRYLYEVVQFYGTKLKKGKGKFWLGIKSIKSFDSVAPVFNSPMFLTDDVNIARRFAGSNGCTLYLRPKYIGDIDNSKILSTSLFNKKIRLIKGTKLQLKSIQTIKPSKNYERVVLAIEYIEKILLQTRFNVHFYNAADLYAPSNMKNAYLLIKHRMKSNESDLSDTSNTSNVQLTSLTKNINMEADGKEPTDTGLSEYGMHLFDHWCFKRQFVTFETFKLEMNYMDYKLKEFLYDKSRHKINIVNVKRFLPNLKHYHDINGILRTVEDQINNKNPNLKEDNKPSHEVFGLLYNCQSHDVPYHIVQALENIHYKFSDRHEVLTQAFKMKLSNLDISFDSFYEKRAYFQQQLISIGIAQELAIYCIESIKKEETIHRRTDVLTLIQLIVHRLQTQFGIDKNVQCDLFTQKKAFQTLYSKQLQTFTKTLKLREKVTISDLFDVADKIDMFDEETAQKLSKYLYIKMMDDRQKIVPWKCKTCEFLNCTLMVDGLWRHYNEGSGMCGDPRYVIVNNVKQKTSTSYRRRRNTMQWDKIMTNQYKLNPKVTTINSKTKDVDIVEWRQIAVTECVLFRSVKHVSCNQFLYLLENHFFAKFFEHAKHMKNILSEHQQEIITYFANHQVNGTQFHAAKQRDLVKQIKEYCDNADLDVPLAALFKFIKKFDLTQIDDIPGGEMKENEYDELFYDCPSLHKMKLVLSNFEAMTNELLQTHNLYPRKMNLYLSLSFPGYSPVGFLNDIDHIIKHKLKHPLECERAQDCIHLRRALGDRNSEQSKNLEQKKMFFNTKHEIDFVYISMLDRAHCLLKHSEYTAYSVKKLSSDDATKIRHTPYSHGVYMEYHTLNPLYQNLFHEIIRNKEIEITEEQVYSDLEASKLYMETNSAKHENGASKTDEKYGIKINEAMHVEHILCIKVYCTYSALCQHFRRSYRKHRLEDTNDDIIRRHCNDHYWFGRFLTTAIEFWGHIPKTTAHFYHRLNGKFVFHNFSMVCEIPTSTTCDINAHQVCDSNGIVLKLSPKYTNEVNNSRCLNVSRVSNFEAREILFSGMTVLSITDIYNPSDNEWEGYQQYISCFLYFERIFEQTIHQRRFYNFGKLEKKEQKQYLVPLLLCQMKRNGYRDEDEDEDESTRDLPTYICVLFQFFCDNKRDYVDLSCINNEISSMDKSLQQILFENVVFQDNDPVNPKEFKINRINLKCVFPNLKEYKNHMGYWVHVGKKPK